MILKKVLQIVSFGFLLYLLADSFMHFDFAASKNEAFTSMQKTEVDAIQNIDTFLPNQRYERFNNDRIYYPKE